MMHELLTTIFMMSISFAIGYLIGYKNGELGGYRQSLQDKRDYNLEMIQNKRIKKILTKEEKKNNKVKRNDEKN